MWIPIIAVPFLAPDHPLPLLIACVALYYAAVNLAVPMWNSVMGDLVPEGQRGRFFGRRTRYCSIANFAALVGAGALLSSMQDRGHTAPAFALIFAVAMIARVISFYHLNRMHEPAREPSALTLPPLAQFLPRLRHSRFLRFTGAVAFFNGAVAVASPLFALFMLRDLHFSYLEFTASAAAYVLAQFVSLGMWGRLCDTFGNRRVMLVTCGIVPLLPVWWLVFPHFGSILLIQMLSGFGWAGFSLAAGNYLYDVAPPDRRAAYSALHNVANNGAIFCGALVGGLLAPHIPARVVVGVLEFNATSGLWGVMLLSAAARALVALLLFPRLEETRTVRTVSLGRLLWHMSQLRPLRMALWRRLRHPPPGATRPRVPAQQPGLRP
jgi:MFS family permease